MQKVSKAQQAVLAPLDAEIARIERILAKAQPYIDELNRLKKTRATLLNERGTTGSIGSGTRLTMEEVIMAMRELNGSATPAAIADRLSVDVNTVRSHLNRHKDSRYTKDGDTWELIGEDEDDDA